MSNIIKSSQIKEGKKFKISADKDKEKQEKVGIDAKQKERKKEEISSKKEELIQQAKKDAQAIIEQAKKDAERINNKAQQEAEEKIEQEKEEAKKKGYQQGFTEGEVAGKEEASQKAGQKLEQLITGVQAQIDDFNSDLKDRIPKLQEDIFSVIKKISQKVITRELKQDEEIIKDMVQQALNSINGEEDIKIKLKPSDLNLLNDYKEQLLKNNNFLKDIKIISDDSIEIGGCVIETNFGGIDATVLSQLEKIEDDILRGNGNDS